MQMDAGHNNNNSAHHSRIIKVFNMEIIKEAVAAAVAVADAVDEISTIKDADFSIIKPRPHIKHRLQCHSHSNFRIKLHLRGRTISHNHLSRYSNLHHTTKDVVLLQTRINGTPIGITVGPMGTMSRTITQAQIVITLPPVTYGMPQNRTHVEDVQRGSIK